MARAGRRESKADGIVPFNELWFNESSVSLESSNSSVGIDPVREFPQRSLNNGEIERGWADASQTRTEETNHTLSSFERDDEKQRTTTLMGVCRYD